MLWSLLLAGAMTDSAFAKGLAQAPPEVRRVIERRLGCNHWGGEEPYDDERRAQIAQAVRSLRCDRLERDERRLRLRHARHPARLKLMRAAQDRDG